MILYLIIIFFVLFILALVFTALFKCGFNVNNLVVNTLSQINN